MEMKMEMRESFRWVDRALGVLKIQTRSREVSALLLSSPLSLSLSLTCTRLCHTDKWNKGHVLSKTLSLSLSTLPS